MVILHVFDQVLEYVRIDSHARMLHVRRTMKRDDDNPAPNSLLNRTDQPLDRLPHPAGRE